MRHLDRCTLVDFETSLKYQPYQTVEKKINERVKKLVEEVDLQGFPFEQLKGLITNEELHILQTARPATLKIMSRLSGIRPTSIYQTTILWKRLSLAKSE